MEVIIRFLNLLIAALVVGSVFGILVSFNPTSLPAASYVEQHQQLVKGLNVLLPMLGAVTILTSLWIVFLNKGNPSIRRLYLIAAIFFVLSGLLTRFGNQPINDLVMTWNPTAPPSDWTEWRDKWWLYHKIRFFTSLIGLSLLIWANLPTVIRQKMP
ncbi:DUF1772 domain-containing protein [Larkinella terrae]|uniref:DUF1772 domain-containing protein n=1 Tax=Larkinella terrae TaxID=2025311 RepID=A0A7K0ETY4_9BACT|nr:DUF1772 domain-containing protein [Larkinella terrae]MRS65239.1 DUF1772 domain-containing protein [Larkinella terrae]